MIYHKSPAYCVESPFKEVNKWDFVYMEKPEMLEYGMNVKMYLDTDKTVYDNLFYYIEEKREDGKWYTIPFKEALYCGTSVRYQEYYDLLPKGEYRVLIPLFYSNGLKQERDYRSVEFTLEHDMGEYEEKLYLEEVETERERIRKIEEESEIIDYDFIYILEVAFVIMALSLMYNFIQVIRLDLDSIDNFPYKAVFYSSMNHQYEKFDFRETKEKIENMPGFLAWSST